MSIGVHAGNPSGVTINSAETMYRAVKEAGIIPFFENPVPGWSVEEKTDPSFWFDGDSDTLGPWDLVPAGRRHCLRKIPGCRESIFRNSPMVPGVAKLETLASEISSGCSRPENPGLSQ